MRPSDRPAQPSAAEPGGWLKTLTLPRWAQWATTVLLILIVLSALGLLGHAIRSGSSGEATDAVTLLTVSTPIMLGVAVLTLGRSNEGRLRELTTTLLQRDVPRALVVGMPLVNGRDVTVAQRTRGCSGDYDIIGSGHADPLISFRLEINVWKANATFWLPEETLPDRGNSTPNAPALQHVIEGAQNEGYVLNSRPVAWESRPGQVGLLFALSLPSEFMYEPAARLYFCQDLAFFARSMAGAVGRWRADQSTSRPPVRGGGATP